MIPRPPLECIYRLLDTPALSRRVWLKQLYADARRVAQAGKRKWILVALDPVTGRLQLLIGCAV